MIRALRFLATIPLALLLYTLLLFLGAMSLGWNLIAMVLHPVLPARQGLRIGRAGISWGYRLFWNVASACRMMRIRMPSCRSAIRWGGSDRWGERRWKMWCSVIGGANPGRRGSRGGPCRTESAKRGRAAPNCCGGSES